MERIYVTETGALDKNGFFESYGVIGVNRTAKRAVHFVIKYNALPCKREIGDYGLKEVTYKVENSFQAYRISIQSML